VAASARTNGDGVFATLLTLHLRTVLTQDNQVRNFIQGQFSLVSARRPDGSTGRSITPCTSENALQTGDVVWVGILAQTPD
jgi:hypothetical protein